MRGTHPRRTVATVGVAAAGLVLGHWLAYEFGAAHTQEREQLLRAGAHAYLPYAVQVAVLTATLGLAAVFLARLTRREANGSLARDTARLASLQTGAFATLEIGERLLAGASLHDLAHGRLLVIGLCVQVAVALCGATLLRLTERAAELAESFGRSPGLVRPRSVATPAILTIQPSPRPTMGPVESRAPPSLA